MRAMRGLGHLTANSNQSSELGFDWMQKTQLTIASRDVPWCYALKSAVLKDTASHATNDTDAVSTTHAWKRVSVGIILKVQRTSYYQLRSKSLRESVAASPDVALYVVA
jgi:hypothetical protein